MVTSAIVSPSFPKGTIHFARSRYLILTIGLTTAVASSPHPLTQAEAAAVPAPAFAILMQPVKLKIKYGETVLPAGMKLQVVSSDSTTVQVNYMGEIQTIPRDVIRFETGSTEQQNVTASQIPPASPPQPSPARSEQPPTVSLASGWDSRMQGAI